LVELLPGIRETLSSNSSIAKKKKKKTKQKTQTKMDWRCASRVEGLLFELEALSSNPRTTKKKGTETTLSMDTLRYYLRY
jgi:hypothetical protein